VIICLDTNCVIYLVENNPVWNPKINSRLAAAIQGGDRLAACDLARAECLATALGESPQSTFASFPNFFAKGQDPCNGIFL
jgi:predicted nucleic acid-binding protein